MKTVSRFTAAASLSLMMVPDTQAALPPMSDIMTDPNTMPVPHMQAPEEPNAYLQNIYSVDVLSEVAGMPIVPINLVDVMSITNDDLVAHDMSIEDIQLEENLYNIMGLKLRAAIESADPQWTQAFDNHFRTTSLAQGADELAITDNMGMPYARFVFDMRANAVQFMPVSVDGNPQVGTLCLIDPDAVYNEEPENAKVLHALWNAAKCGAEHPALTLVEGLDINPAAMAAFINVAMQYGVTDQEINSFVAFTDNYSPFEGLDAFISYYMYLSGQTTREQGLAIMHEAIEFNQQIQILDGDEVARVLPDTARHAKGVTAVWSYIRMLYLHQNGASFDYDFQTPIHMLVQGEQETPPLNGSMPAPALAPRL